MQALSAREFAGSVNWEVAFGLRLLPKYHPPWFWRMGNPPKIPNHQPKEAESPGCSCNSCIQLNPSPFAGILQVVSLVSGCFPCVSLVGSARLGETPLFASLDASRGAARRAAPELQRGRADRRGVWALRSLPQLSPKMGVSGVLLVRSPLKPPTNEWVCITNWGPLLCCQRRPDANFCDAIYQGPRAHFRHPWLCLLEGRSTKRFWKDTHRKQRSGLLALSKSPGKVAALHWRLQGVP